MTNMLTFACLTALHNKCMRRHVSRRSCATFAMSLYQPSVFPHIRFDMDSYSTMLYDAQRDLCSKFETIDGEEKFCSDLWNSDNGEGNTRGRYQISIANTEV